ncbi:unnamed protein product [Ectocarpus fasciculatus]
MTVVVCTCASSSICRMQFCRLMCKPRRWAPPGFCQASCSRVRLAFSENGRKALLRHSSVSQRACLCPQLVLWCTRAAHAVGTFFRELLTPVVHVSKPNGTQNSEVTRQSCLLCLRTEWHMYVVFLVDEFLLIARARVRGCGSSSYPPAF